MTRRSNTAIDIIQSGEFIKIGKKHYAHGVTGQEIKYDNNAFTWRTPDGTGFTVLHAAVSWLRHSQQVAA